MARYGQRCKQPIRGGTGKRPGAGTTLDSTHESVSESILVVLVALMPCGRKCVREKVDAVEKLCERIVVRYEGCAAGMLTR